MSGLPTMITFDLFDDDEPLVIGLDIKRYTITDATSEPPTMTLCRPYDTKPRTLELYYSGNHELQRRLRLNTLASASVVLGLMSSTNYRTLRPSSLVSRLHRFSHAPESDMEHILRAAGKWDARTRDETKRIAAACDVCARSGQPLATRKISLSHVNQAFNEEVQADYVFCNFRDTKHTVVHIVDIATAYSEASIVASRDMTTFTQRLECDWFNRHGTPLAMSADDELDATTKRKLKSFLLSRGVAFRPRPVRRHNKLGVVERKNGTLKRVIERIQNDHSDATDTVILSRAVFLSNCFAGSQTLSAFQLARGYSPPILGSPRAMVTEQLLDAHRKQQATRAIQRMLRARSHSPIAQKAIKEGDDVYFYYRSTKQNEKDEWKPGTITSITDHYATVKNPKTNKSTKIGFEDLRLRPRSALADTFMQGTVEDFLQQSASEGEQPQDEQEAVKALTASSAGQHNNDTNSESSPPELSEGSDANIQLAGLDIGTYAIDLEQDRPDPRGTLSSNEQEALTQLYSVIGSRQVTAQEMQTAPDWLVQKAIDAEMANWTDAYEDCTNVPAQGYRNIISSHLVYKVKQDEDGKRKLKARLVLHGHRDDDRHHIRTDSAAADLYATRLVISIGVILGMTFAVTDIKRAYLQSGPITRDLFVRPPRRIAASASTLWRLLRLPYGISDAGRQWQKTSDEWLVQTIGMTMLSTRQQLFIKRNDLGRITLILAKTVDDFLVAGMPGQLADFLHALKNKFQVGKCIMEDTMIFNGCTINIHTNSVTLSMDKYIDRIKPISLSRSRRQQLSEAATQDETSHYRTLAGTLMYLGSAVLPQAALTASLMQQRLANLKVSDITSANDRVRELLQLVPAIIFRKPAIVDTAVVCSFSDAAHGGRNSSYGQTGGITGLRIRDKAGDTIFHPIGWTSTKQTRVSHSSYGAEIIACADIDERGYDLRQTIRDLFPECAIKHEVIVDSKALFDTITTIHECREYRMRRTVVRLRDAFEGGELNVLRWIPGKDNHADSLTKHNTEKSRRLNEFLARGHWDIDITTSEALDHEFWN